MEITMQKQFGVFSLLLLIATVTSGCIETIYEVGGFTKDAAEMQVWKKLALDGDVEAQYKLGEMYCCGERPHYDNVQALKWWCKAAKQGQRDAQFKVGMMYEDAEKYPGNIIPKNLTLAYTYYTIALKNGQAQAENALAEITEQGLFNRDEADYLIEQWPHIACEINR